MNVGDKVRIVNYGHLIWSRDGMELPIHSTSNDGKIKWYDIRPDLVGEETVIIDITETQGKKKYGTSLFYWANKNQLEKL